MRLGPEKSVTPKGHSSAALRAGADFGCRKNDRSRAAASGGVDRETQHRVALGISRKSIGSGGKPRAHALHAREPEVTYQLQSAVLGRCDGHRALLVSVEEILTRQTPIDTAMGPCAARPTGISVLNKDENKRHNILRQFVTQFGSDGLSKGIACLAANLTNAFLPIVFNTQLRNAGRQKAPIERSQDVDQL
jgi:hypothetical protein